MITLLIVLVLLSAFFVAAAVGGRDSRVMNPNGYHREWWPATPRSR